MRKIARESTNHESGAILDEHWLAKRTRDIEVSGIRKVFDLAADLKDPVNLSIGQPDFDVPEPVKTAARNAIGRGRNGYTVTQGIPELRLRILADVQVQFPHPDRDVLVTSGTSGALALALFAILDPGDEVIVFDPYFVMYPHFVTLAGGKTRLIDTYPNFDIDLDRVNQAICPRTKAIIVNSPANPTGKVYSAELLRDLASLADEKGVLLISDEVYRAFCYDEPFMSPAEFNQDVLVVDGFSKKYGMTGWRLGYCHGPRQLIDEMTKLQQFTYVCAPSMVQHAGVAALDCNIQDHVNDYKGKRDLLVNGLKEHYELCCPGGAFYLFPRAPWGTGSEFVAEAIRNNLLIIPGGTFSKKDTHFRISYAASDTTLERGIDILRRLAAR